ncbi:MAG: TldD/PmbA family protein [Firmicutes bacterium]|nr:TldD/PmbA family protein [Bacillota bacterium]
MRDVVRKALDTARARGAAYADARVVTRREQDVVTKNGKVESVSSSQSRGIGVRVLVDGAWGFASTSVLDDREVMRIAEKAVEIARASALVRSDPPVELAPVDPVEDRWGSPMKEDPFSVKLEEKINLLLEADRLMRQDPRIRVAQGSVSVFREDKVFASTEGTYVEQSKTETGAGISALAAEAGEVQRRSYPSSFGGDYAARGYEYVREMDLVGHAEQVAHEALALLEAPQCPSGTTTVILGSGQLALQVHESCGHPSELDRVFGTEASYAGTSFITPDKLGKLQYGSAAVNIVADATIPGGLGSFGYDDEGVPAQRVPLVRNGLYVNYLTSRETAARLSRHLARGTAGGGGGAGGGSVGGGAGGTAASNAAGPDAGGGGGMAAGGKGVRSNGTMRADGWNRLPIIRMTNINLEPGDWSFEELVRDTKEGIYMETNKSWSIDDKRLNFQFGTEIAWEIKDGSLGRMLKNPTYTGITPEFWRSCDAVCDRKHWHLWGLPNCGKGEPPQLAHVGHGTAPARFRNVRVGVGKW